MTIRNCLILILVLFATHINAQLCQGSLGYPVVNITFGAGSNPGAALDAATTSYGFRTGDCPNDGFYTVINTTNACFGNSWHTLTKDHTGNGNGYFMLVNASIDPGDFYVDTVRGLCPSTTFEFAAWIINVLKTSACTGTGIKPNLTFLIETTAGLQLQKYNSGDIFSEDFPLWKQYGFFFKTPADVSDVVVRIRNNAPGGCGNDLALDDITFRPCGPEVKAVIQNSDINIKNICDYDTKSYTLTGTVSDGYTNPAYQWQFSNNNVSWTDIAGATTQSYIRTPTPVGTYYYRMAVAEAVNINSPKCRILSNNVTITVESRPVTTASGNTPVCESSTLILHASGGSNYVWTGPNNYTAAASPANIENVTAAAAGKYYVIVSSAAGCEQKDSITVTVVAKPIANAGNDRGICEGSSTLLTGMGADTYSWLPATGLSDRAISNPVASPLDSIIYTLTTTDNLTGCIAVDSVAVFVYRKPIANAGADKAMIEGESVALTGSASGTVLTYNWTPAVYNSNPTALTTIVTPPRDTTYTLHVVSEVGCGTATDDVFIKVYKKVIVPNAFSPNKDGINDTWKIIALDAYPDAMVNVFNRYGQSVFTSKGSYTAWNGTYNNKELPIGTYYYVIDLRVSLPKISGSVVILR